MAWILSPREKRALLILLHRSPCSTRQVACGLGYGTVPTRSGYVYTHQVLSRLRDVGVARHEFREWHITDEGRAAAELLAAVEPKLQTVAA